jgi:hypothetical protein
MIENQFDVQQPGSGADNSNTALSGYSLQSDMLTSAYFNSEVGDLRETLGAYQIKINNKKHRAIFLGGLNNRDGKTSCQVDINAGNYPIDVADTDTNTGLSFSEFKGIPNITLKGNSVSGTMPLYPLTKYQNKAIKEAVAVGKISENTLKMYQEQHSIMDLMDLLKNTFSLTTVNTNLNTPLSYDTSGFGVEQPVQNWENSNSQGINNLSTVDNSFTINNCVYISLTSAVTQWVRVSKVQVKLTNMANSNYEGLVDVSGNKMNIQTGKVMVKLIIDGSYCPRQMIGNGMSHQQLFVWGKHGSDMNNILQFTKTDYLAYVKNDTSGFLNSGTAISVSRDNTNHFKITLSGIDVSGININTYLYAKGVTPYNTNVLYKVVQKDGNDLILNKMFSNSGNYQLKNITTTSELGQYTQHRFNIDDIRDRYSMLQLLSHLGRIYRASTGLSLPLKLVEYVAQVKSLNSISNLLKYVQLCELYTFGASSSVDIGKKLNQIFHYIQDDNNFYSDAEGGNYGTALKYWDDKTDCVVSGEQARFTCLNTNLNEVAPKDTSGTYVKSNMISRVNKVKHVVITNLPGFINGRYGSSMSSSNLINGFFGSLSIDLSYSDTHTPVDVNGMTVHQWDIDSTNIIDGLNNPSRWNVNADENYRKAITAASLNC